MTQTVAVIGLGYVGLPLCWAMHRAGHMVIGIDVDDQKIASLQRGESYLKHLDAQVMSELGGSDRFQPTSDMDALQRADAILICVPTPLDEHGEPDLQYVKSTADEVGRQLRTRNRSQTVVLESTTYPGTTREVLEPILRASGVPFRLAFSPERMEPGRIDPPMTSIPKLVGGIDDASTEAACALYGTAFETVVPVASADIAEAAKLLENVYRAVNIALVNEMKTVLAAMNIDIWPVVEAAATKPFGFHAFYPGPGLGGHCIPIDPFYLSWKAKQHGVEAEFIELAGRVNRSMPARVVEVTARALGTLDASSKILILGLAYKPNIDDVRESPSFELIRLFRERGCDVAYSDPHVEATHSMRHYGDLNMTSVDVTATSITQYDAVVVSTAHAAFDWPMIASNARLIIDTRNALQAYPDANVVKA